MKLRNHNYRNPVYNTWKEMRRRCSASNRRDYKWYGGKGITVCEAWQNFQVFCDDMLLTYFPGATIERINNTGNYEPSNCCWKTISEQQQHRSNTPHIGRYQEVVTLRNKGLSQTAIGKQLGMSQATVSRFLLGE